MIGRSANKSLLVVGSVALDDIDGPYGTHRDILGGSASFFATAASYFTKNVSVIAIVGDDFPQEHLEFLASRGVDISGVDRVPGESFHWYGKYADDLATRETIDTKIGVFADFDPTLGVGHQGVDLLFLGNIHPALQLRVANQCGSPDLLAADTMNLWIDECRGDLEATLAAVQLLIINDEEARQISGEHNLARAAQSILAMGPHSLVIKRGDAGAYLFHERGTFAVPALPLEEVKDPTGAGDAFAGGFMGYLAYADSLEPEAIRGAMICGSVMASYCVEQFSLDGMRNLDAAAIQRRYDAFHELSAFERISL